MRNLQYKNKSIKVAEDVWAEFYAEYKKYGKTWNQFIKWMLALIRDATREN